MSSLLSPRRWSNSSSSSSGSNSSSVSNTSSKGGDKTPHASVDVNPTTNTTTNPFVNSSSDVASIREVFSCHICIELFDNPHTLDCGHSFCGVCLSQWLSNRKQCPECRYDVIRRPIPSYAMQQQVEVIRPFIEGSSTKKPKKSVENESLWTELFPVHHRHTFIIDEEDENTRRCGICTWELEPDGQCTRCSIQFYGAGVSLSDSEDEGEETGFFNGNSGEEDEENSSVGSIVDFIVDDEEDIVYDSSDEENTSLASESLPREQNRSSSEADTLRMNDLMIVEGSDTDTSEHSPRINSERRRKKLRQITLESEDDESSSTNSHEPSERYSNHTRAHSSLERELNSTTSDSYDSPENAIVLSDNSNSANESASEDDEEEYEAERKGSDEERSDKEDSDKDSEEEREESDEEDSDKEDSDKETDDEDFENTANVIDLVSDGSDHEGLYGTKRFFNSDDENHTPYSDKRRRISSDEEESDTETGISALLSLIESMDNEGLSPPSTYITPTGSTDSYNSNSNSNTAINSESDTINSQISMHTTTENPETVLDKETEETEKEKRQKSKKNKKNKNKNNKKNKKDKHHLSTEYVTKSTVRHSQKEMVSK